MDAKLRIAVLARARKQNPCSRRWLVIAAICFSPMLSGNCGAQDLMFPENKPRISAVSTSRTLDAPNLRGSNGAPEGPHTRPAPAHAMMVVLKPRKANEQFAAEEQNTVEEPVLRLSDLHALAFQIHPELREANSLVSAARGLAYQAGLQDNPNVGIDFQQLFSGGQAEQYGISIEQRIVRKRKRQLDRSVQGHEAARLTQEAMRKRYRIANRISSAFVSVLTAKLQVEVAEQLVTFNTQALETTQKLFLADEVAKTDALQAELETESARQLALTAHNTLHYAWKELEYAVGQQLEEQRLDSALLHARNPIPAFEGLLQSLRAGSPEVAAAMSTIEKHRCFLARQRIETQPDISTAGLLNVRDNGIGGGVDAGIALSVPVPLFNKNQGAISAAWHNLRSAEQALQKLELELASRLTPVHAELVDAHRQVHIFEDSILPLAQQVRELTEQTYEQGEATFQHLLIAGRTHAEKQLAYLAALKRLRYAEIRIEGLLID